MSFSSTVLTLTTDCIEFDPCKQHVCVCKTSWPCVKEAQTDDSPGTALHASLSGEIMVVSVCQLEPSLSSLLEARSSRTLLPG